jgi:hypothetical protein
MSKSRRVVVISDVHIEPEARMMSQPEKLGEFIGALTPLDADELELVIAGDFIDFLALPPLSAWTQDPEQAVAKIEFLEGTRFKELLGGLRVLIANQHALTILAGNHDVELSFPKVQAYLERILSRPESDPVHLRRARVYCRPAAH